MKKFTLNLLGMLMAVWGVGVLASCDDEKFSASPAYSLSFSTDTVSFDTVFTTLGSATYKLVVYNRNNRSLRIESVSLPNADKSGFRVNVDGHQGTDFSDLEIRRKDSMFVFIEVKVDPTNQDNPILVRDSLVFQLESGVQQDVKLQAYGRDVLKLHGLVVGRDTSFSSYRPILVYDSLQVKEGVTLTLEAGTQLYFHDKIGCEVYGTMVAKGTLENPIVFRGDRLDKMPELDLPYDRVAGQWGGLHFMSSSYDNRLNYVDVHGGQFGIRCDSSDVSRMKLLLENSTVHNVKGNALELTASQVQVGNCQITNAGSHCVSVLGGDALFVHCTIANFYSWDIRKGEAVHILNKDGEMYYPLEKAFFYNCLISGSKTDELSGGAAEDAPEEVPFGYGFAYCLVNTVLDEKKDDYEQLLDTHYPECVWDDKEDEKGMSLARSKNFVYIGREDFLYDFRLDSISAAVNIGAPEYALVYPLDKNGRERLADGQPDAGCYEWMPGDKRREE